VIQTVILRATELLSFAGIKISTGYFLNGEVQMKKQNIIFFIFQIQEKHCSVGKISAHNFSS